MARGCAWQGETSSSRITYNYQGLDKVQQIQFRYIYVEFSAIAKWVFPVFQRIQFFLLAKFGTYEMVKCCN